MCAFVLLHGVTIAEGAAAVRAAVRPLPRVDAQVSPQVSSLAEALGAVGAAVRPLACVCTKVSPQVGRLGKGLAAPVAGVGLSLLLQVEAKTGRMAECLATTRTALEELRDVTGCCTIIGCLQRALLVTATFLLHHRRPVWPDA